jgi:multidrug resistance efflux pump
MAAKKPAAKTAAKRTEAAQAKKETATSPSALAEAQADLDKAQAAESAPDNPGPKVRKADHAKIDTALVSELAQREKISHEEAAERLREAHDRGAVS